MSGPCEKVFLNGKIAPFSEAVVSIYTMAFRFGATVFEGLRSYWNDAEEELFVFRLQDHSRRLEESVKVMRMDTELTAADFSAAVLEALEANNVRESAHIRQFVYLTGTGEMSGPGPVDHAVIVTPKGGWFGGDGISVRVSSWQRIPDTAMPPRVKCAANYQNGRLALLEAHADGYDGTILLNETGHVSEEARGCLFLRRHDRVITPSITSDVLESITRETMIELFRKEFGIEVVEREVDRTELYSAQEIYLCGSGFEVIPVVSVDRLPVGDGKVGEITRQIRELYLGVARGEKEQYRDWLSPVYKRHVNV
jgi:branched-chain amino acid aminotransferase